MKTKVVFRPRPKREDGFGTRGIITHVMNPEEGLVDLGAVVGVRASLKKVGVSACLSKMAIGIGVTNFAETFS